MHMLPPCVPIKPRPHDAVSKQLIAWKSLRVDAGLHQDIHNHHLFQWLHGQTHVKFLTHILYEVSYHVRDYWQNR